MRYGGIYGYFKADQNGDIVAILWEKLVFRGMTEWDSEFDLIGCAHNK
jgi:hypothetical protein